MRQQSLPSGTVTFVFTDIEGSTRLLRKLRDDYASALGDHSRIITKIVRAHGGHVVDTQGDSFMLVFASPEPALNASRNIQLSLSNHEWPHGATLRVRIGIHTGEGLLHGDRFVGMDVHRAARVGAAGHGGQIIVSETTHSLSSGLNHRFLRDLGAHQLKDLERPMRLFQLLAPGLLEDFPPLRSLNARPNNLPAQLTAFIGREREIRTMKELLEGSRLLTLLGPGGIGKTRIALQLAAEVINDFRDGCFFVPLATLTDPDLLASAIASRLGLVEDGSEPANRTLKRYLKDKELLLILDNFEQIVDGSPLLPELLESASRLKMVVTSRSSLRLSAEQDYHVPSMSIAQDYGDLTAREIESFEAVQLFCMRANAVSPQFELSSDNAATVASICDRLEGLPLAIELAAARLRLLTPEEVLGRLSAQLSFLTQGSADLPSRQRTLRATIDWSYRLLDQPAGTFFNRLGVFRGGWGLEIAHAVCNPSDELGADTLDLMSSLLDQNLIRRDQASGTASRLRMLEAVRQFAADELAAGGEFPLVSERHARFFMEFAEDVESELIGRSQVRYLDLVDLERSNIREAISWSISSGEIEVGLRIAGALWRFWHLRGLLTEGRQILEQVLESSHGVVSSARGKALGAAGALAYWQMNYERALDLYEDALTIHRVAADPAGMANDLYGIAFVLGVRGNTDAAREAFEESRKIWEDLGDEVGVANAISGLGFIADISGDLDEARRLVGKALESLRDLDDKFSELNSSSLLARILRETNDNDTALNLFREVLTTHEEVGYLPGLVWVLREIAALAAGGGDFSRALRLAAASQSLSDTIGGGVPLRRLNVPDPRATARGSMSQVEIDADWDEGLEMSLQEAVAYALKDDAASRTSG